MYVYICSFDFFTFEKKFIKFLIFLKDKARNILVDVNGMSATCKYDSYPKSNNFTWKVKNGNDVSNYEGVIFTFCF